MNFLSVVLFGIPFLAVSMFAKPAFGLDLPGGLFFGQSFKDVETTARDNAWKMQKSEVLPYAWNVEDAGLTLYFCEETLTSVDQVLDGSLVDFVETVFHLKRRFETPDTSVAIVSPRSRFETHSVQSVFETERALRISVQLFSRDEKQRMLRRISNGNPPIFRGAHQ